jgi:outer membrane lipoprotein LolB
MTRWLTALLVLTLAGCAPLPVRDSADGAALAIQAAREAQLVQARDWHFTGRIAVSDGADSGNARIHWRQQGDDFEISLSAPVTRKSWRLVQRGGVATLEGLDGGVRSSRDAQGLLYEATGWQVPLQALAYWARGGRAPGEAQIELDADGLPALIVQQGWAVEYREWGSLVPRQPRRVFARHGQATVRLVVDAWGEP